MSNYEVGKATLFWATSVLHPGELHQTWREVYNKEGAVEAKTVEISKLKTMIKSKKTKKDNIFRPTLFDQWLDSFTNNLKEEITLYKLKTINTKSFFSQTRISRVNGKSVPDYFFSDLLHSRVTYLPLIETRMTKEEALKVVDSFKSVFLFMRDNLFVFEKELEKLTKLNLPTETQQLNELLNLPAAELAETFSWAETEQGYHWWATKFLEQPEEKFISLVAEFFSQLDPAVEAPKIKKSNPLSFSFSELKPVREPIF
jgi:hypothetical protein